MADETKNITLKIKPELADAQGFYDTLINLFRSSIKNPSAAQAKAVGAASTLRGKMEAVAGMENVDPEVYRKTFSDFIKTIVNLARVLYAVNPELQKATEEIQAKLEKAKADSEKYFQDLTHAERKTYTKDGKTFASDRYKKELVKEAAIPYIYGGREGAVAVDLAAYRKRLEAEIGKEGTTDTRKGELGGLLKQIESTEKKLNTSDTDIVKIIEELRKKYEEAEKNVQKIEAEYQKIIGQKTEALEGTQGQIALETEIKANSLAAKVDKERIEITKQQTNAIKGKNEAESDGTDKLNKNTNVVSKAVQTFFGYQAILRTLRTLWRDAIHTITELDKALTEQAVVSSLNREETWKLVGAYQELALQTGFTTTEIAAVATEYFKQGKTTKEVLTLTEAAAKSAKVAGISARESVDYLTTAINGFHMAAEDALAISDKFAALAATSATDYDELAIALSKVASQANLAGMSMDYTLGLLAKGLETTKEAPESIGTALKTVIARMREITDYGETLEDGISLNNVEKQLAYVDIALRDTQGELRSTEDVLDELGRKWDTLGSTQQAAIAKALAGSRQQSRLISMLNNYERTLELIEVSSQSLGATNAQQVEYLEGMDAAVSKLKTSYQAFITAIVNNEQIITIVQGLADLIKKIADFLETDLGKITLWGGVFTLLANLLPLIIVKMQQMVVQLKNGQIIAQSNVQYEREKLALLNAQILAARTLNIEQGGSAKTSGNPVVAATNSPNTMSKTVSWINAGMMALTFISAFITNLSSALNGTEEAANKAMEGITKLQSEIYTNVDRKNSFTKLIDEFETLDAKVIKTSKDLEDMQDIRAQLLETFSTGERAGMQDMSLDQIVRRAEAKTLSLEEENREKLKEVEKLFKDVSEISLGEGLTTIATQAGIGAATGLAIGSIFGPMGAGIGAGIGGAVGIISGTITTAIKEAQYEKTKEKVEKMLATDEGLAQAKYLYAGSMDTSNVADKEERNRINAMYQSVISTLDAAEMEDLILKTGKSAVQLADEFKNAMVINSDSLEILSDSGSSTRERIEALSVVMNSIPTEELSSQFKELYSDLITLNENFPNFIDYMDALGLTVAQVNEFEDIATAAGLNPDEILTQMGKILLPDGKTLADAATATEQLNEAFKNLTPEMRVAIAEMIDAGRSLQSIAEDQTKAVSEAKSIRETQSKWSEMTAAERADFISSNPGLFLENGEFSQEKFDRFTSGGDISSMIASYQNTERSKIAEDYNQQLIADQQRLAGKEAELALAETDAEKETIKAEIEALKGEITATEYMIENLPDMYELSLAEIVKAQQAQIAYQKEVLQEQQDNLIKSLEKRKEAYQNYFDAINEAYKTQTYEEDKARILEQMGRLGAGTDATSLAKAAELQKQLVELEKGRAEERRQAAQDAVMKSIDNQIETSNEKFDEMIKNDSLVLAAINEGTRYQYQALLVSQGKTPEEISSLMQTFDTVMYDRYNNPNVNTPVASTVEATPANNNQFNFSYNNQQISFTNAELDALGKLLRTALSRAGISLAY